MAKDVVGKHMVWVEKPAGKRIGITYSTLKEALSQVEPLERSGYTVIEIVPTSLPKPNV
jgi:hypothetical protein